MSTFTSTEVKLRTLALQDPTMLADLGPNNPGDEFRWYNRQLLQNKIGEMVTPGSLVRVTRISTLPYYNQGGLMPMNAPRFQLDVLDFDSERCRKVANDLKIFLNGVDLMTNAQFTSPVGPFYQNPCFLLNQRAGMISNPASPRGPVFVESLDYRIYSDESISI